MNVEFACLLIIIMQLYQFKLNHYQKVIDGPCEGLQIILLYAYQPAVFF